MKVLIIGAGGHAQVVADIFLARLKQGPADVQPLGFLDDNLQLLNRSFLGLPVLGSIAQYRNIVHDAIIVAIGHNQTRRRICRQLCASGQKLISAIHPQAIIGTDVEIGQGTSISAGVVVNPGARIGDGVILNTGCTVDHHNQIGDYGHIAPGAHLGGDTEIGSGTLVGIGAIILPQRRVGAWSIVGAGAVVTEDIPTRTTAVGAPARIIKSNELDLES